MCIHVMAGVTIDQAVGGVQASRLQSELEALHLQTQATPPSHPRPESAASGRSSRSRGRNKKRKGTQCIYCIIQTDSSLYSINGVM